MSKSEYASREPRQKLEMWNKSQNVSDLYDLLYSLVLVAEEIVPMVYKIETKMMKKDMEEIVEEIKNGRNRQTNSHED